MTSAEINLYIRENYETLTGPQMAKALGMGVGSVRTRMSRMGLKRPTKDYYAINNSRLEENGSTLRMVSGYTNRQSKATFECTNCGTPRDLVVHSVLAGAGVCHICAEDSLGAEKDSSYIRENSLHTILDSQDSRSSYIREKYLHAHSSYIDKFSVCVDFQDSHYIRENSLCADSKSRYINQITENIRAQGFDVITEFKMPSGKHIDIYIPEKNIGIEYNGEYWHSSKFKDAKYHIYKTIEARESGITLMHVFENDYIYKRKIIADMIFARLGVSEKLHARKCVVSEITPQESATFLDANHLQGGVGAQIHLGLFFEEDLVSVMTFSKSRFTNHEYEVVRMATLNAFTVVGGASKLLKYFVRNYQPQSIVSYCHLHHSTGASYEKLGFTLERTTPPGYWYHKNSERLSRHQCQKGKLQAKFPEHYAPEKTEQEIMAAAGWYRVHDCGNRVFVWTAKSP